MNDVTVDIEYKGFSKRKEEQRAQEHSGEASPEAKASNNEGKHHTTCHPNIIINLGVFFFL